MLYEIINDKANFMKPLQTVFENRNIPFEIMEDMLNPTYKGELSYKLLPNIELCAERIIEAIKDNEKIFLQVDSDADGYTSAAVSWMMLVHFGVKEENIVINIHKEKEHGVIVSDVPEDCTLVLIPDAGSNQFKEHKELKDLGKTVIVIDHHETSHLSKDAIVVNNQFDYPNKSLSGVGVVYKVFQALEDIIPMVEEDYRVNAGPIAPFFLDLVAVGMVADMMDVINLETMYYIQKGMKNINNPFLKAIIKGNNFKLAGDLSPMKISFYIAPLINAMVRTGSQEEKLAMFNAMIRGDEIEDGPNGGFGGTITLADAAVKICGTVKRKQDRDRDEGLVKLHLKITRKGMDKNKIIIGNAFGIPSPLRGLIAMQLAAAFKKPTLVLAKDSKTKEWSGSGRGINQSDFKNFKDYLNSTGLFIFAEGHQSAFGAAIKDENLQAFIDQSNEDLKEYEFSKAYKIDLKYSAREINSNLLAEITVFKNHYAKGFEEPFILIKSVPITKDSLIVMGKNPEKPSIKIMVGDINFVMFSSTIEEVEKIREMKFIDIIGRANENEWNGEISYQIFIEDYEKSTLNARDLF